MLVVLNKKLKIGTNANSGLALLAQASCLCPLSRAIQCRNERYASILLTLTKSKNEQTKADLFLTNWNFNLRNSYHTI